MYVELKDINKTFGDYKASDHVSFGIEKGKLIGLLGPSGSGKTTLIKDTLQDTQFMQGVDRTLILCLEEGEEEYDPAILKANNTVVEVIENEEDFTTDRLVAMDILHQPERVIIEYNGMWLVSNFEKMQLPKGWGVEQQITCVDGSTFQMYMANMKSIFMDMIKNTDMVIFNRCKKEDPLPTYRRGIKVANQRAEVIFEDEEGKTNLSLDAVGGELLLISQFTLYANCKKGNRPSFVEAGKPDMAEELYEYIISKCKEQIPVVERGMFGADMKVSLVNDGPFTIVLDSDRL